MRGLYPVMISRDLHDVAPLGLLDRSLRPATGLGELSPADRVFGWVNQAGNGAYRGNLRLGPIDPLDGAESVERFDRPLPLAILGQPKPHYGRFYVARTRQGQPQPAGLERPDTAYREGKGLRGRKIYPHHRDLPQGYWQDAAGDDGSRPVAGNRYRDYLRAEPAMPNDPNDQRADRQNRSIEGWVKPGSRFRFDIHVTNLSAVELGALVWLLDGLPDGAVHRLGGGKPLGFGSVRLRIAGWNVHDGAALRDRYVTLAAGSPAATDRDAAVSAFRQAVTTASGAPVFERAPWIAAFLTAARGIGSDTVPVHYPRAAQPGERHPRPRSRAENFRWFQENDRPGGLSALPSLALPQGQDDPPPLPVYVKPVSVKSE
ncbi:TIGR03986 family type III CRISPR-associated RAMP protein [Azospirillum lipoferum]|uniref:TIGR03986 family CRISPR-associated RAMP protein n=1 Tax=Azospirillum lipoferum (strain 4B) TaxID=862719 RepID=G7ZE25_AZOL4|nr:TIGR03986 family CRISPR-associated RAMP protein [Azospirillum lipoferum]CBS89274.1 conserved protein of unknown function [Azospirillum lipoferum 4B]